MEKAEKDEIFDLATAQDNKLIDSVAKMDTPSFKIFELAVASFRAEKGRNGEVKLNKDKIVSFLGIESKKNITRDLVRAFKMLARDAYFVCLAEENGTKGRIIMPIEEISWDWSSESDEVTIRFSREIIPMLIDLKRNFTQYNLKNIAELESRFSIAVYKLCCLYHNKYRGLKANGKYDVDLEAYREPVIKIAELRKLTNTVDKYASFYNFEQRVLSKAVEEINEKTNLKVSYRKIYASRKVVAVKFQISSDREERILVADEQKRINAQEKAQAVMARESFALLLGSRLLNPLAVTDFELVAGLDEITNAYDEFLKTRDKSMLIRHLDYVRAHMLNEPKDLSTYLKTAFENWQKTLAKKPSRKAESENATDFDELARIQNKKAVAESGLSEEEYAKRELAEIEELKKRIRKPKEDR